MSQTEHLLNLFLQSSGVNTDTRTIQQGQLFLALKGPNFNGNQFAHRALDAGALHVVLDEPPATPLPSGSFTLVENGLKALQQLANAYRKTLPAKVLAIGGSNGKTTTKELVTRVLVTKFKTFATPGNLNNHIGVPLTLLKTPSDTEMLVVEMGANEPGEIAELCEIAEPDFGLITNIGKDHLEGFGTVEGVAAANSELFYYLYKHQGQVFVNTLEPHVMRMASRFQSIISYPKQGDYYHAEYVKDGQFYLSYLDEHGKLSTTNLVGTYNFANVATALCVGKYFGTNPDATNEAIASYRPANNRSQIVETGRNRVILDAYNANPSSMQAAIENFLSLQTEKKALFLGDMLEMGHQSQAEHEQIGLLTKNPDFELVGLVGKDMKYAADKNPKARYFETPAEAKSWLKENKLEGYTLLLKGSRGLKMEQLIEEL